MSSCKHMPVSLAIICLWVVCFIVNCAFPLMPLLSGKGIEVIDGAYYRLFTGFLLHGNVLHLAVNIAAMFWLGDTLEHSMGSVRFLLVSALGMIGTQGLYLTLFPQIDNVFGGSILTFTYIGMIAAEQFLTPDASPFFQSSKYASSILLYAVIGNLPLFPFMNGYTVVLHGVSFLVGCAIACIFHHIPKE